MEPEAFMSTTKSFLIQRKKGAAALPVFQLSGPPTAAWGVVGLCCLVLPHQLSRPLAVATTTVPDRLPNPTAAPWEEMGWDLIAPCGTLRRADQPPPRGKSRAESMIKTAIPPNHHHHCTCWPESIDMPISIQRSRTTTWTMGSTMAGRRWRARVLVRR